ncbi:MAG: hypothetical protein JWO36_3562 [Myxococcales bacterium]|nr:hypothetical protein [Myxococcales bacterium]
MDLAFRFRIAAIAIAIAIAGASQIAVAAPKRTFVVDFGSGWRAEAMTAALASDLVDDQLAQHAPLAGGDGALRAAGIDLVVHGAIDDRALRYDLRALWPGAPPPVRGVIELGTTDRAGIAGVLRDKLHRFARATSDTEAASGITLPSVIEIALALALVAALLLLPFVLGTLRLGAKVLALPALRKTAVAFASIGGVALAVAAADGSLPSPTGILLGAGGLAWGAFVTVTMPIVFPPLVGLNRVEHDELGRVLRSWLGLALLRAAAIAALYTPTALATWAIGNALDLDRAVLGALVVPLALLIVRALVRAIVAVCALSLDEKLIDISADVVAWDAAVRAYLVGYFRRNGLPVDRELLSRVKLLPGATEEVAVYGGGLTHSRIVIPRKMLELALAPWGRPHDYAAPRVSTLHWSQWNAGLVVATEPGAAIATREQRQPREMTVEGDHEREALGEPPTLAGIIEPRAFDPRTSYRPHDDPMWLDWDSGEEYDGTDAGDRDFLFGLLVHSLGRIQRHADRWSTMTLLARRVRSAWKLAPVGRLLERAPAAVGDDHAALGGARHHLLQYLSWQLSRRDDLLTARAYAPELEAASRRLLGALSETTTGDAQLRRRMFRLGAHVAGAVKAPVVRWRRYVLASVLVAGTAGAVFAIANAVRYHATYVERMTNEGSANGKTK